MLACILSWIVLARGVSIPRAFDYSLFYDSIAYALRAHLATLFGFLMARMGVLLICQSGNFTDLGYWSVAAQIADALLILPGTVTLLLFPSLVRAEGARAMGRVQDSAVSAQLGSWRCFVLSSPPWRIRSSVNYLRRGFPCRSSALCTCVAAGRIFPHGLAPWRPKFLSASGFPWSQVLAWIFGAVLQAVLSITCCSAALA